MYIKFKQDVNVIIRTNICCFSGTSTPEIRMFKKDQILRIVSYHVVGEPNKKIKTRPGQLGGRKTIYKIDIISDEDWKLKNDPNLLVQMHPDYFEIDSNLIEFIKEPQSADN